MQGQWQTRETAYDCVTLNKSLMDWKALILTGTRLSRTRDNKSPKTWSKSCCCSANRPKSGPTITTTRALHWLPSRFPQPVRPLSDEGGPTNFILQKTLSWAQHPAPPSALLLPPPPDPVTKLTAVQMRRELNRLQVQTESGCWQPEPPAMGCPQKHLQQERHDWWLCWRWNGL